MAYIRKDIEVNGLKKGMYCRNIKELEFEGGGILEVHTLLYIRFITSTGIVNVWTNNHHWLLIPYEYLEPYVPTIWERIKFTFTY